MEPRKVDWGAFLTLIRDLLRSLIDGTSIRSFVSPKVPEKATRVVFHGFFNSGNEMAADRRS
ncbi:hypothetical protein CBD41_06010 [bacterium TMED181]|nr:hypothetical protein [Planctomycetota bacterium]OUW44161.1 MAG: hypothetical protein CBD41_06010 [bacterium TMED181]